MVITDNMKPYTANGLYHVPIVDHRAYLNVVETWPAWFDNFHRHCAGVAADNMNMFGQLVEPPRAVMIKELEAIGGWIYQFDTQDGWMLTLPSEECYTMLVLKWG